MESSFPLKASVVASVLIPDVYRKITVLNTPHWTNDNNNQHLHYFVQAYICSSYQCQATERLTSVVISPEEGKKENADSMLTSGLNLQWTNLCNTALTHLKHMPHYFAKKSTFKNWHWHFTHTWNCLK